ncbi:MAG TPA: enoyl-CoA hydratase [Polyangiaceae bacterium]|jgi:enoyl-CoA hydratase
MSEAAGPRNFVLSHREGDVCLLTLNRPERRNALNIRLAQDFVAALEAAEREAAAIVVTGAGSAFCAGLDLRDLGVERLTDFPNLPDRVRACPVPVIAAVNGAAVTGGFEIALAADFLLASTDAVFADTHLRVGVFPGPVLLDLPRRVGMAWARQMSLTGDFVDSLTALRIGLVNEVHAPDQLLTRAVALASAIAENDAGLVAAMRSAWTETEQVPLREGARLWQKNADSWNGSTADGIAARREAVLKRSRQQRS